jgi:alanyl-tRNA synthetase
LNKFPKEEYYLPFFEEEGYIRKLCPKCREYFWTQNPDQNICGEATSEGCAFYDFINSSPTNKSYSLSEMREKFLSFFEKRGHKRINPYPVVARWRNDIYLTHASIIDFQPYVTEGISPAPANPLAIVQPCIRMVDIANTGPTFGRHLTIFEMGGHHAFNYPDKEIYWKDQTVRYHQEFVTEALGVKSEEVIYKEGVWIGGGNAGPDVESIIKGLEVATLVFMQYKVVNNEFVKLPIRTVDTGYGIDRYTWLSQGVPSCFEAIYGSLIDEIFKMTEISKIDTDLLVNIAKVSGLVSLDKTASRMNARRKIAKLVGMDINELDKFLLPIENVFAVTDHTKSLCFILSEGIIPSNIQEGYLARLLFRRIFRLLKMLGIQNRLYEIISSQINFWSKDYPHIKEMQNEIIEILSVEEAKFKDTLKRGTVLLKRISTELKTRNIQEIPVQTLIELYDSHGLPPEIVKPLVEKEGLKTDVPEKFYAMIAERHVPPPQQEKEVKPNEWLISAVKDLPETKKLFYQDQYLREFEAKVIKLIDNNHLVLDQTCFYPEGGGQPADKGHILFKRSRFEVVDVQKIGKTIVHKVKETLPKKLDIVKGVIDWNHRYDLMKNHTATHLINGAARRVLGQHIWQFGTQKAVESSRLDLSHYRRITLEEIFNIETLANHAILQNIPVETEWMPRNKAENLYGFRLYQGGAVPDKEIRIVKTGNWEVEACAGTHLKNTGEIGFIKIIHSERVQDGVERLIYSIGIPALKAVQRNERILFNLSELLNSPIDKLGKTTKKLVKDFKLIRTEKRKLVKDLALRESNSISEKDNKFEEIKIDGGITLIKGDFQKIIDIDQMIQTANEIIKKDRSSIPIFYGIYKNKAHLIVMAGKTAITKGINAIEIVKEASALINGGGGGKLNFAQGGGPIIKNLTKAVKKAEEIAKKQVKK